MIDEIISNVKNVWEEFGFYYPFPKDITTLLQSRNRIILFFIDPEIGHFPQVIVKLKSIQCERNLVGRLCNEYSENSRNSR